MYSSLRIILAIILRRVRWVGNVVRMEENKYGYRDFLGNLKERDLF